MARKAEVGIDYFPMNTDIIHNPKIRLVVAEFGSKISWTVLLPLYCKIYREKGYWIDWFDDDSKLLFAQDDCKIELNTMNEFVNGCLRRSLFNKEVYDMFGVLTSDRIQENYLVAKARNKDVLMIEEFAVKNEKDEYVYKLFQNVNIIDLDVNILKKKVNISTQKKKEKKIIEGEGESGLPQSHTKEEAELFKKFKVWLLKYAPRVDQMKDPLTIDEYFKLKKGYAANEVSDILLKMHNYKPLLQKNVSAYLTFLNWIKKDFNNDSNATTEQQAVSTISELLKAGKQAQETD